MEGGPLASGRWFVGVQCSPKTGVGLDEMLVAGGGGQAAENRDGDLVLTASQWAARKQLSVWCQM